MKLVSVNCTIEVSKDANGYSNNYYVDIDENGVSVSHPYIKQIPEQVMFVNNIITSFIANAINFNSRINVFNKEMGLEEYAPHPKTEEPISETTNESVVTPPIVETTGSDFDLDAKPAVSQVAGGGSDTTDLVAHSEQEQERLDMEELEAREIGSDKA